tara:strand:+ start:510 stop:692 length:183 start_codon:yes stop_codon:yes gene_type:complete
MSETDSQKQSVMSMSNLQRLLNQLRTDEVKKSLNTQRDLADDPLNEELDDDVLRAKREMY